MSKKTVSEIFSQIPDEHYFATDPIMETRGNTDQPETVECDRCGNDFSEDSMNFSEDEAGTDVYVCNSCYYNARN